MGELNAYCYITQGELAPFLAKYYSDSIPLLQRLISFHISKANFLF